MPRRRRRADGPAHAPALDAGVPDRGSERARRHAGAARRCSARTWSCSATATAASACWTSTARIAALRWSSAATRNAACAASTTAGRWTSKATCVEMVSEPAASRMAQKVKHKAYPVQEWGGFVWAYMGPKDAVPEFRPPAWAPTAGHARSASPRRCFPATGRRSSKARSTRRTARACIRPTWCRRASTAPKATDKAWLRPSTDKAPRMQVQRTRLRLPLCRAAPADHQRRGERLRALDRVRRARHRADPAEQPVQRRQHQRADATTRAPRSTSSPGAIRPTRPIPRRGASSWVSASASTSTSTTGRCARSQTISGRTARR